MPKILVVVCAGVLIGCGLIAADRKTQPREYRHRAVGKPALARSAGVAAWGHLRIVPREWGRGTGGFTKRFGAHLGQNVAKQSIRFGVAALHHENLL